MALLSGTRLDGPHRPAVPARGGLPQRPARPRVAARVGLWLGICFLVTLLTGVFSHFAQQASTAIPFPSRPVWGYRVTQGLHVAVGTAAVPLLLVKLWTVYPRLFARPPRRRRGRWSCTSSSGSPSRCSSRPRSSSWPRVWPTPRSGTRGRSRFRATHYAVAWIAIGALVVHVAVKLPVIRRALARVGCRRLTARRRHAQVAAPARPGWRPVWPCWPPLAAPCRCCAGSRCSGCGPATGPPACRSTSPRAPRASAPATTRSPPAVVAPGPRGLAAAATTSRAMPQTTASLPIACVEGWSAAGHLDRGAGARPARPASARRRARPSWWISLQERGPFRETVLPVDFADDDRTLLALGCTGRPRPRPRLPLPADRPEPARRAADQVGLPAGGAGVTGLSPW